MTTVVSSVISKTGNSHGTGLPVYSTIESWQAACPTDLVAVDQVWKGICYNDGEFAPSTTLVIGGVTTDSTRYIWLTAGIGQSFGEHATAPTNALKYDPTKGVAVLANGTYNANNITVSCAYTLIEKLQFKFDYASSQVGLSAGAVGFTLKNSIVYRTSNYGNNQPAILLDEENSLAVNCLLVTENPNQGSVISINRSSARVVNCTAIATTGSARGAFNNGYSKPIIRNCLAIGLSTFSRDHSGYRIAAGSGYNATNQAYVSDYSPDVGPSPAHSLIGINVASTITSQATPDGRIVAGASVVGAGTPDVALTGSFDIIGQTRSATAPTIGCWEYQGVAAVTSYIPKNNTPATGPILAQ